MKKLITVDEAIAYIRDGMTVMVGGFLGVGTPHGLVDVLVKSGVKDLTLISNDTGFPGEGVAKLVENRQVKRIIASYIGGHPETGRQMSSGETEVTLLPQGTLAECIRCGGVGLGGVLTPTGIGTVVAEGKQTVTVNGRNYLLELPLKADIALIKAHQADGMGNLIYRRAARNFNPIMAMAADTVIAEVETVLESGYLDPDHVMTPGIFVHRLVKEGEGRCLEAVKPLPAV